MTFATLRHSRSSAFPEHHNTLDSSIQDSALEQSHIPGSLALLGALVVIIVLGSGIYSVFRYLIQ